MNVALLSQPQRELRAYLQRVAGDGGIVETPGEASTFVRRLRSAGVLGSTVIAGVAGGVKAGTLYSIIGPDLDVTRGTVKNRVNRAGVLSSVASGVPATDFAGGVLRGTTVEPSSRNEIRNNTMQGAVVGVVGSGGAYPTHWTEALSTGGIISREIIGTGPENGIDYLDLRIFGTATANGSVFLGLDSATQIVASSGQAWAYSIYAKTITGTPSTLTLNYRWGLSGGGFVASSIDAITLSPQLSPFSLIRTAPATTERVQPRFEIVLINGASYDFTIRIGLPQMELGSVATSVIKTTGSAQTRNADVISKTGLGSVLPQTEGWVYAEVDFRALSSSRQILMLSDNSDVNRFSISVNPSNLYLCNFRFNSTSNDTTGGIPPTGKNKMLIYFSFGSVGKLFLNGLLVNTNSIGTPTNAITKLNLGSFYLDTAGFFNDPIHSYAIGSGAITDASAIQLTTL
jgi:hypothetical protein